MKKTCIAIFLVSFMCNVLAQEKTITEEIAVGGSRAIEIDNRENMRLEFVSWKGDNLKISYTYDQSKYPVAGSPRLDRFGFGVTRMNGKLSVQCRPVNEKTSENTGSDQITIDGKIFYRNASQRKTPATDPLKSVPAEGGKAVFYIPAGKGLIISNTGAGKIAIRNSMAQAEIEMNGGELQVDSLDKLVLKSVFANVVLKTVAKASITINGGQLFVEEVGTLSINSSYTQPRIDKADSVHLASSLADNYTIGRLGALSGSKTFGSCMISTLEKSIVLEKGKSNTLQVSRILPGATLIKLNNTSDSLVLPVSGLTNYSIRINAPNRSELRLTDAIRRGIPVSDRQKNLPVTFGDDGSINFQSHSGDISGRHTVFDLDCSGCKIIFN